MHPPTVLFRVYTPKSLVRFDGREGSEGRILLAIGGVVFDVSAGRSFYGPGRSFFFFPFHYWFVVCFRLNMTIFFYLLGGMYGNFAGRDASRGMAKQSFDVGAFCVITDFSKPSHIMHIFI